MLYFLLLLSLEIGGKRKMDRLSLGQFFGKIPYILYKKPCSTRRQYCM